jgi:basic membrane protein A and related proteins
MQPELRLGTGLPPGRAKEFALAATAQIAKQTNAYHKDYFLHLPCLSGIIAVLQGDFIMMDRFLRSRSRRTRRSGDRAPAFAAAVGNGRITSRLACRAAVCLAIAASLTSHVRAAEPFKLEGSPKIAFIYTQTRTDGGWVQSFDEARMRMEKALNTNIAYIENVKEEKSQFLPPVEKLIARGYNIIIATSFGYSDPVKEAAAKYPKIAFLNGSGTTNGPNLVSFYPRTYEGHYLCGMVAGSMTKTGKLGHVSPFPFGVVNWTINAFLMGAQQMKPGATVTAVNIGAWDDAAKERAATLALIDQGADVIDQQTGSPTPQIVAQERGVYGIGNQSDMRANAPKATLCSVVYTWDLYLTPEVKKIVSGDWAPSPYGDFVSIKDGGSDIACCNTVVPAAVVTKVEAARQEIMNGKQVFAGPIKDAEGNERVPAGKVLGDADLWKMDWFIPGVIMQK